MKPEVFYILAGFSLVGIFAGWIWLIGLYMFLNRKKLLVKRVGSANNPKVGTKRSTAGLRVTPTIIVFGILLSSIPLLFTKYWISGVFAFIVGTFLTTPFWFPWVVDRNWKSLDPELAAFSKGLTILGIIIGAISIYKGGGLELTNVDWQLQTSLLISIAMLLLALRGIIKSGGEN